MLMFNQTVTLYHYTKNASGEYWTRTVLRDIYFSVQTGVRVAQGGQQSDDGAVMYLPRRDLMPNILPGDKLVEGECTTEVVSSPSELHALSEVHTVTAVRDFPFGGIAHQKVWCDWQPAGRSRSSF